jgi:hypothetical protein
VFSSLQKKNSENNLLFVRFCDDSIEKSGLFSEHNLCFVEAEEVEEEEEEAGIRTRTRRS